MSVDLPGETPDTTGYRAPDPADLVRREPIALVDLLDRVLAGGVVIMGDVRLSIADVDLVTISLQALISSVSALSGEPGNPQDGGS